MPHTESTRAARALVADFARRHPSEAATAIENLPQAVEARWLEALPALQVSRILERVAPELGARALTRLADPAAGRALAAMEPGRGVALLEWLEPAARERYLELAGSGAAQELRAMAAYPDDSAGRLMDPRVTALREGATARTALAKLRSEHRRADGDVFVIDADGRLTGRVAPQDLALAPVSETVGRLSKPATGVLAMATRAEIVEYLGGGHIASVPVVDIDGHLVGVIRAGALVSAAQDEASADMQAMVGASRDERALSKVSFAVRKRLPWLHINLATAFLAAAVVGLFEETIARFTALAVLLPVVAGQSGNTGAQALAVTMRGLALREVRPRHWLRITFKESRVALINGVAVACTTSAGVWVWSHSLGLTLVIGSAMVISMLAAGLAGAIIPIGLTVSGQDPAQASSIILTTVTDVVGFLSFLGLASLFASALWRHLTVRQWCASARATLRDSKPVPISLSARRPHRLGAG